MNGATTLPDFAIWVIVLDNGTHEKVSGHKKFLRFQEGKMPSFGLTPLIALPQGRVISLSAQVLFFFLLW